METGESARLASEIFAGFQTTFTPVQVEPFRYSPPFGNVSVSEATDGSVESTVTVTVPLATLESLSVALSRILKFEASTFGTVQAAVPPLDTDVATDCQTFPPSEDVSMVTGLATGETSDA